MSAEDDVSLFDYRLPPDRIAQVPLANRSDSRLMHLEGDAAPVHPVFHDLPHRLRSGDLLVRNVTQVIPAKLRGRRVGGGKTELLLVRETEPLCWDCLARPASHLKPGRSVTFAAGELVARIVEKGRGGHVRVRFELPKGGRFEDLLDAIGETPLPPYIHRPESGPTLDDRERYQTVYASAPGAVAAPTAGLHFTLALFDALQVRGVQIADLVLHVGPGTFRPVKVERVGEHVMEEEFFSIPRETAAAVHEAKRGHRRVIAVGTTATRALEAAALASSGIAPGEGSTALFIHPPYRFRVIDGLLTNFHLPKSTLLMLACALAGRERILAAYATAIQEGYRFYSYGDAMLILP
ncbi:MAG: tRNA preQ1(34) S-adenosylmethionine ribosyltransferase-isomerase QueA [Planctomycetota bacterium]